MSFPKAYAATTEAARKDATQPHVRRLIPPLALSVATTKLAEAHNSEPMTNAAHGRPPVGVGGGIGPVLPIFCAASARRTNDVPAPAHQKPTESFSRDSLPLLTHLTCPHPRVAATAEVAPTAACFTEKIRPGPFVDARCTRSRQHELLGTPST